MQKEDIKNESVEYLAKGFENLERHVDNLKNNYGLNVIVAINKYTHDTENEIKFLQNKLQEKGINLSLVESWEKGGEGAEEVDNCRIMLQIESLACTAQQNEREEVQEANI